MNHLAHLLLADLGGESLPGVLMGDFVKGRLGERYDGDLARGILLHRRTDSFMDGHPRVAASRRLFSRRSRRYAGIILDVCYDHFLLRYWRRYSSAEPATFTRGAYAALERERLRMPPPLQHALPRMIARDWLHSCETLEGVGVTLARVVSRLSRPVAVTAAMGEVQQHYATLEDDFLAFFPDVLAFTARQCSGCRDKNPLVTAIVTRGNLSPVPGGRGD